MFNDILDLNTAVLAVTYRLGNDVKEFDRLSVWSDGKVIGNGVLDAPLISGKGKLYGMLHVLFKSILSQAV
ncbi:MULTISPECIES: hypothetical protein [Enterobacterales]|uniref:hypothetical protein n=1 Tax=Enterobacterales TaxID=91347 RepID=UPI000D933AD7|nr:MULTISPECIES: hypothetical protein [Enterobacterales]MCK1091289.1 hypothetical protein [Serratia marcescens]MCW1874402.1 hypothetical protein [Erwinia sp. INIA01]PYA60578.1 hypothetical protein DMW52_06225 [Serratia marcescens]